jgi:hypothetical protein
MLLPGGFGTVTIGDGPGRDMYEAAEPADQRL